MTTIAGVTNPGHRPGDNQDSIGWDEARSLAFVADGLGGHASGQIASGIVKQTMLQLAGTLDLRAAVLRAHAAVVDAARQGEQVRGMASTIVAVQIARRMAKIVWAGDSRAYLWRRPNQILRLTRDHSVVEELRDPAGLSEADMRTHPQRNEVTNVLGAGDPVPSVNEIPLQSGDWILLCSDGLTGELTDEEIASTLTGAAAPGKAAEALIAAALERGGHDNVSAVLVEYDGPSKRTYSLRLSEGQITWLAVLGGIVLAVVLAGAWWWLRGKR
jgi:protein phosphatase